MKTPQLTIRDICMICGKMPIVGFHKRRKALNKSKRLVRPNLGQWNGLNICAKCRKAMAKPDRIQKISPPVLTKSV